MTTIDVLENLAEECHSDHVGLWEVIEAVRSDLGFTNPSEIRMRTLDLVRCLLAKPGMQVGHPAPDGREFVAWDVSSEQALKRIAEEWSALVREPNIGEVAWFTFKIN